MNVNEAMKVMAGYWKKVIGHDNLKAHVNQKVIAALHEQNAAKAKNPDNRIAGFFKPMFLEGAPGQGKSKIMKVISLIAENVLGVECLYYSDGEECGTALTLAEKDLIPEFNDKPAWVFIDEFHRSKKNVQNLVCSLINPDVQRSPVYRRVAHDLEICAHPLLNSFIIATNEVDKVNPALLSRCEHRKLDLYTPEQLAEILMLGLKDSGIQFHENTVLVLADALRGTARFAVHMTDAIRTRCDALNKKTVSRDDANKVLQALELYPQGVYKSELKTLLHLEKNGAMQLKELADANVIASKEQNEAERFLRFRHFIKIDVKRHLTSQGQAYLQDLRKHKFELPILG